MATAVNNNDGFASVKDSALNASRLATALKEVNGGVTRVQGVVVPTATGNYTVNDPRTGETLMIPDGSIFLAVSVKAQNTLTSAGSPTLQTGLATTDGGAIATAFTAVQTMANVNLRTNAGLTITDAPIPGEAPSTAGENFVTLNVATAAITAGSVLVTITYA